jgi:hypothetical protein
LKLHAIVTIERNTLTRLMWGIAVGGFGQTKRLICLVDRDQKHLGIRKLIVANAQQLKIGAS